MRLRLVVRMIGSKCRGQDGHNCENSSRIALAKDGKVATIKKRNAGKPPEDQNRELFLPDDFEVSGELEAACSVWYAEINLSSKQRWREWHHQLRKRGIGQKLDRLASGIDTMTEPLKTKGGKRRVPNIYIVILTGTEEALAALEWFRRPGTLLSLRKQPESNPVPTRGSGQSSKADQLRARARQRTARDRLGDAAARCSVRLDVK